MSAGHSDAFVLGVHCRTQEPPGASAGTDAQNVSAQPGWSAQTLSHAAVQMPGESAVLPLHEVPIVQSVSPRQWSPTQPRECGAHTLAVAVELMRVSVLGPN